MGTDTQSASRRIVGSLFAVQSFGAASVIAVATVLTIVAVDLTGNPSLAGLPSAVIQFAMAGAAVLWGSLWDRLGRRNGLTLSLFTGLAGTALVAAATQFGWVAAFYVGILGLGGMRAGTQMSRFIAGEVSTPDVRGRAISLVVWGGTVGSIVGPLVVGPSSRAAVSSGLDELVGPILVGVPLIALAILIAQIGLRPEPSELARTIQSDPATGTPEAGAGRSISELIRVPGVYVSVVTVVLAQAVMIMLMGITALYMRDHGHQLTQISIVFSAHTLGMFAFAPIAGRLADRSGRGPVMFVGCVLIIGAVILAPALPGVPIIGAGLWLLGLGWSFCFVAGSALLSDQLTQAERSRTQGANDMLIALASALGSLASGVIYASQGFVVLGYVGGLLMLVAAVLSGWWTFLRPAPEPAIGD